MPVKDPQKTSSRTMDEMREYHARYLTAVNNPIRRQILRALKPGARTVETLESDTGLRSQILEWHLSILEHGSCVRKEKRDGVEWYQLTKEGRVVDYMDKEATGL
jgi:DNA-binding transcriptional ArsR family regulator